MDILQKSKIELLYDPAIPLLDVDIDISKENIISISNIFALHSMHNYAQ